MTNDEMVRLPRAAIGLLMLVGLCLLLQLGLLISSVLADVGGGAASTAIAPDTASDQVAATAAEFRVDESGAATYSIPLYALPGTAGVSPKLSLSYSSQGGYGALGKGWSISGLSTISRCRATREAGDFIVNGIATDGNSAPVNFTATDRYCLDGQRLVPAQAASAACPASTGMSAQNLRTEIESFQRVCAYTASGSTGGVNFFTVERKDGSISWYGDRDNSGSTANRADGYFNSTASGQAAFALSWAQTRFQDSTGNYIDFIYIENPAGVNTGEQVLSEVRYAGKTVLAGQTGTASAPYAKVMFTYSARPSVQWGKGFIAGGALTQSRRLDSVTACAMGTAGACAAANQARFYQLTYAASSAGSTLDTLASLQECRDSTKSVCLPATAFTWSAGKYEFATKEYPANAPTGSLSKFEGFKMGDVDGDGRQDIVYLKDGSSGEACPTEYVFVLYGVIDTAGQPSYVQSAPICTPAELMSGRGEGSWHLLDYNSDGRDDLFVAGPVGQGWQVYLSQGRAGNANFLPNNVIANLAPVIPAQGGKNDQVQLADLNGDGLTDVLYPSGGVLKARIMEWSGTTYGWGAERTVTVDMASLGPSLPGCEPRFGADCTRSLAGAPSNKTGFMQLADFNGDAASDVLLGETQTRTTYTNGPGCNARPQATTTQPLPSDGVTADPTVDGEVLPYALQPDGSGSSSPPMEYDSLGSPCYSIYTIDRLHTMVVKSITATTVKIASYAFIGSPYAINLVDVNGDGLTDLFYRLTSGSEWQYSVNTGSGLQSPVEVALQDFEEQTRFADVNGDGRTDILHPVNPGAYKTYAVLYQAAEIPTEFFASLPLRSLDRLRLIFVGLRTRFSGSFSSLVAFSSPVSCLYVACRRNCPAEANRPNVRMRTRL